MEGADVRRAVAEDRHGDVVAAEHLGGVRRPGCDRDAGADDGERRQQPHRRGAQVHRPAAATEAAHRAAGDLAEHLVRRQPERQGVTVPAVRARDAVARSEHGCDADGDRLLALARVRRAVDQPLGEQLLGAVLEAADLEHPLEPGDPRRQRGAAFFLFGRHVTTPSRCHHGDG